MVAAFLLELKTDKVIGMVLWRMRVYCSHNYSSERVLFHQDPIIQTKDFFQELHFFI